MGRFRLRTPFGRTRMVPLGQGGAMLTLFVSDAPDDVVGKRPPWNAPAKVF